MRILIVDDEENIHQIMVVVLEAMGHETVSVGNSAPPRGNSLKTTHSTSRSWI